MNKFYPTSDTAEASFLMAHGVKFLRVEKDTTDPKEKYTIILEEQKEGQIGDLLLEWGNHCPEKAFFLKYKWVLKQVNNGKRGE